MSTLMPDSRLARLEKAWELGVAGDYDPALEMASSLLIENPIDVDALRLQGNLLELKAMDRMEYSAKRLSSSADYLKARQCYEKILAIDSLNVKARIDLGEHYRNLEEYDRAMEFYRDAVHVLQQKTIDPSWKEDVEEICKAVSLLTLKERVSQEARLIEEWCTQALRV
jgi:tetratricopeptide (TPR) repeat protein